MKKSNLFFYIFLLLTSCGNGNSNDQMDLELREKELELKERELALENSTSAENVSDENTVSKQTNSNNSSTSNYNSQKNNSTNSKPREKSSNELFDELYLKELKNPNDYLTVDYSLTYKVLSGEDKITGNIYNSSTIASFKDVVLSVTYSTDTGTKLGTKEYVVYDYVYSGGITPFLIKTYSPEGTKKIGVYIKTAKGI